MEAFWSVLADCSLSDLDFVGRRYTWERNRFSHINIRERLDWGVATAVWQDMFPNSTISHRVHSIFDHCPLCVLEVVTMHAC